MKKISTYLLNYKFYDLILLFLKKIIIIIEKIKLNILYTEIKKKRIFPSLKKTNKENVKIIVSLTTYPARYKDVVFSIKSILLQSVLPDKIILYLGTDCDETQIPEDILNLREYGVEIKTHYQNIKPHKKYFYAMQEYPNDIIITIDDDLIFDKNLISDLLKSYYKYPNAVSTVRVHRILVKNNCLLPYKKWDYEYISLKKPSYSLISTNGAGSLFPPHSLPKAAFDINKIIQYSLNADDIWIKFMLLKNKVPVVLCNSHRKALVSLSSAQENALSVKNVIFNKNDEVIKNLEKILDINLVNYGYIIK